MKPTLIRVAVALVAAGALVGLVWTLAGTPRPPHPTHHVDIAPGSMLSTHLGEHAVVDSYHHQAVERLGEGLRAVAWSPDGVVEAVELPGASAFVLAVQWELHEEWQDDERSLGVWRALADASGARMRAREPRADPALRS